MYPIVFKAAILERNNEPLVVDEVTFAGPLRPGQVLVRIHYSGICGKQIEEIKATAGPDPYLPHMLGHEGAGVVVDIGPGVSKVTRGDRVVLHWLKGSGIESETPIYANAGRRVNAGRITTFNEYGVISENRMTTIPREIDLAAACLLGCAVTTGVGVVLNEARVRPGESVAVFGCGGVGLNAINSAALVKSYPIIGVDTNSEKLNLALKFGASHIINFTSSDVLAEIRRITVDRGANYVIVALGDPQVIEVAVQASSIPGSVFLVGVPNAGAKIQIDPLAIHRLRTILGSYGGGTVPERDIPRYLVLYQKGQLKLKELITKTVSLDSINDGVASMLSGKAGRCIVRMTDDNA